MHPLAIKYKMDKPDDWDSKAMQMTSMCYTLGRSPRCRPIFKRSAVSGE